MRVLIAEDDAVSRHVLSATVEQLGHEWVAASNGLEAWEAFGAGEFEIVLTDWMMPALDGADLCRRIRAHEGERYPYIIFLTGLGGSDHVLEGMEAGADDYLVKPVDRRELEARFVAARRVTGLHRAIADRERRLEQMNSEVERTRRLESLNQLAGGIAHDFNNSLAVILSYVAYVSSQLADSELKEEIEEIRKAAEHSAALTHQLLVFTRRTAVDVERIDVGALVADMEDALDRSVGKGVRVETGAEPTPTVEADRRQLERAILDLAANGSEAMRDGGGTLRVTVDTVTGGDPDGGAPASLSPRPYVRLSVADEGCGMEPDVAARAFDPFFTTKPAHEGAGLGLAAVHGTVAAARGHVDLVSVPGESTRVSIYLPASASPGSTEMAARS